MGAILQGDAAKTLVLCGSPGNVLCDFGRSEWFARALAVVVAVIAALA